jgi:TatD DNase family protein
MNNPIFIDTHTHLDFDRFDADRDDVIRRAQEANVASMITIGVDYKTSIAAIKIAEENTNVYAAIGVHPHDAENMTDEQFDELCELLSHPKVVAVGEVGLDYHYDYSPQDVQRRVFRRFLDVAKEKQMPVIIHTREADEDILAIIKEKGRSNWQGVFHCFSGDEAMAKKVLDLGFFISFTGTVTFKNSDSINVAKSVPLDRLMIETDCPFLAPAPKRGKRNEPAYVVHVAQKIAEAKQMTTGDFAQATTLNALRFFNINLQRAEL